MKKTIYLLFIASSITVLNGCNESSAQKEASANKEMQDTKRDLEQTEKDAEQAALKADNAAEWAIFKERAQMVISRNETTIRELKATLKNNSTNKDAIYAARINRLGTRNYAMQIRIDAYAQEQTDWPLFKRNFNHDTDELQVGFRDLAEDGKK